MIPRRWNTEQTDGNSYLIRLKIDRFILNKLEKWFEENQCDKIWQKIKVFMNYLDNLFDIWQKLSQPYHISYSTANLKMAKH